MTTDFEQEIKLRIIIRKIANSECIICGKNLGRDLGITNWHIPLCKEHREEYLTLSAPEVYPKNFGRWFINEEGELSYKSYTGDGFVYFNDFDLDNLKLAISESEKIRLLKTFSELNQRRTKNGITRQA